MGGGPQGRCRELVKEKAALLGVREIKMAIVAYREIKATIFGVKETEPGVLDGPEK